jgi:hypothetical protein
MTAKKLPRRAFRIGSLWVGGAYNDVVEIVAQPSPAIKTVHNHGEFGAGRQVYGVVANRMNHFHQWLGPFEEEVRQLLKRQKNLATSETAAFAKRIRAMRAKLELSAKK